MELIKTKIIQIDNEKRIAFFFGYNNNTIKKIKSIKGRKWSVSNKFWHIPFHPDYLHNLNNQFEGQLKFKPEQSGNSTNKIEVKLPPEYIETMKLKNYSEPTIKTYRLHFLRFLKYYSDYQLKDITQEQIRKYLLYLVVEKQYSTSAQNQAINAIKFYYDQVLQQEIDEYYLPRPKREKTFPQVLNEMEVSKILKCIKDLRDKCMIFLIYSAGLTPSEVTYIKVKDINSGKMKIFISSAKRDQDRFVVLSKKLLDILREYYRKYNPQKWLFESYPGKQYSKRKLQKSFQSAVRKSGISKPATLTILKNSFAVHLIEKGVDVRFVQQMLGHKHSKTTMKYLKVSKRDLSVIQSPLDNLDV
ncbi:MAG TPA: hypothetical protein ENL20_12390 [Candidatus Cloacimonetes bacterium]|nr:hypothetical protein [Candidatus Cloacimonadota bacterium]